MIFWNIYIYKGAQAIGMGKEAQSVAAAADLYTKANHILGYVDVPFACN